MSDLYPLVEEMYVCLALQSSRFKTLTFTTSTSTKFFLCASSCVLCTGTSEGIFEHLKRGYGFVEYTLWVVVVVGINGNGFTSG